jgi:diaminopimelate epimerase
VELRFAKYHGAGNDFILVDDRQEDILPQLDRERVAGLCHRHFGIGADGLMLLRPGDGEADFEMVYYNSDGRKSTLCGNGSRCIIRFAADLGIERDGYTFRAADGIHAGRIAGDTICLGMHDIPTESIGRDGDDYLIDTGSPHYITFRDNLKELDVVRAGREIRNGPAYREAGINVNFVRVMGPNQIELLTYERGVENETLACGTGVTAAALAYLTQFQSNKRGDFHVDVRARGGELFVRGGRQEGGFTGIELWGPAERVFEGRLTL